MKDTNNLTCIDLFSGCGGLSYGLIEAGIDVRVAVEIDQNAKENYSNNINDIVLQKDITKITGPYLLQKASINKGDLFLLAACPPCQGFSTQRKDNDQNDPRNNLVFEFVRLTRSIRPKFILMENVSGMTRGKNKVILDKAINALKKQYIIKYDVINCADYGVPQRRKRLVVHGIRKDLFNKHIKDEKVFTLPPRTHKNPKHKQHDLPNWITVWDTINELPPINAGEEYIDDRFKNHKAANLSALNLKRIRYIREHGGSRNCLPQNLQLKCHKTYKGHTDVYGILAKHKPAVTITGGCTSYSKGRYGHPEQDRALSIREAARLQTFPDTFIFQGSLTKMALEIGNAVPVKLAKESGLYFINLARKYGII